MDKLQWRRYAPWINSEEDPAMGITNPSFQDYLIETTRGNEFVRSMLSPFELALLYGTCRHSYEGRGEIVDGGPLLGVGTYAMARGLAHNQRVMNKRKRIYSFDLWLITDMGSHVGDSGKLTGSVFERFLEINRDFVEEIYISPGDLLSMKWDGRPIEILFVDIAKTTDLNSWVLRNWFTSLIPDLSIVIQQDYVYFDQWWIAVTMEYFRDSFECLEFVYGASCVFRCVKSVSPERIERFLKLSAADHLSLMRDAIAVAPKSVSEVLKCGQARMLMRTDPKEAARILETVRTDIRDEDPVQNFSEIAHSNLQTMRQLLQLEPNHK